MSALDLATQSESRTADWQREFVQEVLVVVQRHARIQFRELCVEERQEAICEAVAAAVVSYLALVARGRNPAAFPSRLAHFAVLRVKSGRHVGGRLRHRDVLAGTARRQRKFRVEPLSAAQGLAAGRSSWTEAVLADERTQVADQAAFRVDFPRWLASQTPRKRQVAEFLALGNSTNEAAAKFQLSPARVSQLRLEFYKDWQRFHGEESASPSGKEALPCHSA